MYHIFFVVSFSLDLDFYIPMDISGVCFFLYFVEYQWSVFCVSYLRISAKYYIRMVLRKIHLDTELNSELYGREIVWSERMPYTWQMHVNYRSVLHTMAM